MAKQKSAFTDRRTQIWEKIGGLTDELSPGNSLGGDTSKLHAELREIERKIALIQTEEVWLEETTTQKKEMLLRFQSEEA